MHTNRLPTSWDAFLRALELCFPPPNLKTPSLPCASFHRLKRSKTTSQNLNHLLIDLRLPKKILPQLLHFQSQVPSLPQSYSVTPPLTFPKQCRFLSSTMIGISCPHHPFSNSLDHQHPQPYPNHLPLYFQPLLPKYTLNA